MHTEFAYDEHMMEEDKEDTEIGTFLAGDEEETDDLEDTDGDEEEEETEGEDEEEI
ncbi:MAG TPA: hypothetical protein VHD31_00430 [Candidatus Paceibacterota bacterium]|nr:hypothetical protein [Candidatus Paceibacterota bacterium]